MDPFTLLNKSAPLVSSHEKLEMAFSVYRDLVKKGLEKDEVAEHDLIFLVSRAESITATFLKHFNEDAE